MFSEVYKKNVLNKTYINGVDLFKEYLFLVQKAHLVMLNEENIIDLKCAKAIKNGLNIIIDEDDFPAEITDNTEDFYLYIENVLKGLIGDKYAGALHTARSRNDMDMTFFKMFLRDKLLNLLYFLNDIMSCILKRSKELKDKKIVLFTHGQPANISTFSHYLMAFAYDILENSNIIFESFKCLNKSPMGACAITTTGFNINRESISDYLGFYKPVYNSYNAIVSSHWMTYLVFGINNLLIDITRLMADMLHKASTEVGMLYFPDELVQISSIMPQKRNPVILEHIRIQAGLAIGMFKGVEDIFRNAPYQDINELADAPVKYFSDGYDYLISTLELLKEVFEKVDVVDNRCEDIAISTGTTTTELADFFVRKYEISFRQSHEIVSKFVKSNYDNSILRKEFNIIAGFDLKESDEDISNILSTDNFINVRDVLGGPSPYSMNNMFKDFENELKNNFNFIDEIDNKIKDGIDFLNMKYSNI
ncbi:argininosuccinate lyase [Oceanotoga teriensis]|uniref:argininosuccinate lyase n=1 Tax=Oceanotoga teriensis TaxID=515440 RepID=A0AA45C781_9BACT|nr:lyase family protein [Oceanotoga teriensis]PWJ95155.1 argininosuccinate lyase [Oceanotoga teriensis]